MSTISPKHVKSQHILDPIVIQAVLVVILTFVVLAPASNLYSSVENKLGLFGSASTGLTTSSVVSFSSDQQYWESNCSHGWTSNKICDVIVQRAESCSISVDSAYCSAYGKYMQSLSK